MPPLGIILAMSPRNVTGIRCPLDNLANFTRARQAFRLDGDRRRRPPVPRWRPPLHSSDHGCGIVGREERACQPRSLVDGVVLELNDEIFAAAAAVTHGRQQKVVPELVGGGWRTPYPQRRALEGLADAPRAAAGGDVADHVREVQIL
jgi:hypothetical protein